jgi:hypothetical protein
MYQLTNDPNIVIDLDTNTTIPSDSYLWDAYEAWLAVPGNTPQPVPPLTFDQVVALFEPSLEVWLASIAAQNGYKSVESCVSYIGDEIDQWNQDGIAMKKLRSKVWQKAYAEWASYNGQVPNPLPTLEQIIALMPTPVSCGWVNRGLQAPSQSQSAGQAGL